LSYVCLVSTCICMFICFYLCIWMCICIWYFN